MSVLRLLLGRRQFLTGFAGSVLALGLWKFASAIEAVFQINIAKKPARGIVVYFSSTGNTASIAKAIHRGMNSVIHCDVIQITKLNPKKMAKYDLVAIGSPNWSMRTPIEVWTFTHDMPRMDGKHCVLFATHGTRPIGQFWFISRNLLKKGMTVIGWGDWYGASLQERTPHLAWGHPDSIDLAEAEAFGKRMAESSVRIYAGETELIPELPTPDVRDGSAENMWTPLVSCHTCNVGYSRFSFIRALSDVNRQSIFDWALFLLSCHAPTSARISLMSPILRFKHCLIKTFNSISAMLSQEPCLGV